MLPFLKKKQDAAPSGMLVKHRTPDEGKEPDMYAEAIMACANELIRSVHAHDAKGVASALEDAFEILESMPHEEGPHIENNEPGEY